jgi:hypothetical protein
MNVRLDRVDPANNAVSKAANILFGVRFGMPWWADADGSLDESAEDREESAHEVIPRTPG